MAKRTTTGSTIAPKGRKGASKVASQPVSSAQTGEAIGRELQREKQNPTMAPTSTNAAEMASEMTRVTHDMIAARAHELWKENGGSDMENWLAAERELRSQSIAQT